METYKYKAMDAQGRRVAGRLNAANLADLETRLARLGLDLIHSRAVQRKTPLSRCKRTSRAELIDFSFHLEQLLSAGVPMVDALKNLGSTIDDSDFRDVVGEVVEAIEGGRTFSEALGGFPGVFTHVYISMVRVGEESGRLPEVLRDLGESLRWQDEIVAYVRRVMVYPLIVLVVVGAAVVFLMIYLVPQLVAFIESVGGELPVHTRALIAVSDFFVEGWYLLLAVAILIPLTIRVLVRRSPRFRFNLDRLKLNLWLFGDLMYKTRLARFCNYFALMYAASITVPEALRLARALMDNAVLEEAVDRAGQGIAEGQTVAEAFARTGIFPAFVVRMMRVGETTGGLDRSLHNVSYFYAREVRETVQRLEPAILPALIVVLGGLVAWIMFSVLGPIYDTIATLDY